MVISFIAFGISLVGPNRVAGLGVLPGVPEFGGGSLGPPMGAGGTVVGVGFKTCGRIPAAVGGPGILGVPAAAGLAAGVIGWGTSCRGSWSWSFVILGTR